MDSFSPEPSPRRGHSKARRHLGQRILVVCGALRTEDLYLKGLKASSRSVTTTLKVYTKGKDPLQVVDHAVHLKQQNGRDYDAYWVVFDVDEFDIGPAVRKARKHNISLAVSNPCFELWLLLHFQDCRRFLPHYRAARDSLKNHLPDYSKIKFDFSKLEPGVDQACDRAERLDREAEREFQNPTSGVWGLARGITGKDEDWNRRRSS